MAKSFLVDINLNKNELQNGVIQNLAADPSNGKKGQVYFNTVANKLKVYDGTEWVALEKGTGTVTSVAVTEAANGGLTISGSPITESGTITIGHDNVITAQSTSGVYPVKIDENGHITEYGDAIDVVSATKDGFAPAISAENTQNTDVASTDLVFDATTGKYATLPEEAFSDTTYEDGTTGYTLKAKQDSEGNQINTTYAPIASPTFTGTPAAPKATKGDNSTQLATTSFVAEAIADLEGSMHYKGTVDTTSGLPATGVKNGDTYKVAENGSYAGQTAKVGDLFIAVVSGSNVTWTYVPSADDAAVTSITAGTGLTGGTITTTGTIALDNSGVTAGTYQGLTVDTYGRVTAAEDMGYTTNEGTVTSVVAGTGLTGGTITESGTIALSDTLAAAQTTSGVYPIKVDKQGRITELGSAVTILHKYTGTITGDDTTTSFTINHGLNTREVSVQVYDGASYEEVIVDVARTTADTVTVSFASAPANGITYKVVVIG